MPRLFNGLWQLSSPAWGSGSADSQDAALAGFVEEGLIAADMADHYVGQKTKKLGPTLDLPGIIIVD